MEPLFPNTLQRGDRGTAVFALQMFLLGAGCYNSTRDEYADFGDNTYRALLCLQAKMGITQSGILDEKTKKAITRHYRCNLEAILENVLDESDAGP